MFLKYSQNKEGTKFRLSGARRCKLVLHSFEFYIVVSVVTVAPAPEICFSKISERERVQNLGIGRKVSAQNYEPFSRAELIGCGAGMTDLIALAFNLL